MNLEQLEEKFSKYEVARILGARALQIAMDAPLLLKIDEKELELINYNPLEIAKRELMADVLPITINRPMPKKKEAKLKKLSREEIEELKRKEEAKKAELEAKAEKELEEKENKEADTVHAEEAKEDESLEKAEGAEEKKVAADDEIMELSSPEDEAESGEQNPETEEEY